MKLSQIFLSGLVAAVILVLTVSGITWALWPKTVEAGINLASSHSSSFTPEDADSHNRHCNHLNNSRHIEIGEAVVIAALDLDDTQAAALEPITDSLDNWRTVIAELCTNHDHSDIDGSLAAMQQALDTSSATLATLRPQLQAFLAGLSEEQTATVHSYMQKHRHRRGHGERGWRH